MQREGSVVHVVPEEGGEGEEELQDFNRDMVLPPVQSRNTLFPHNAELPTSMRESDPTS
jgi:hypothetical protein